MLSHTSVSSTGSRKDDHVRLAVAQDRERAAGDGHNHFDDLRFVHHALAGVDHAKLDTSTVVANMRWRTPLYINAMTGGSTATGEINSQFAVAARETGLAIASGSTSAYLRDPATADTFRVLRRQNPHGHVIANINANTTVDGARRAAELLAADAVQIHVNAVQEIVMPEGDRDFTGWSQRIGDIAAGLGLPVIVKEVGFGLSRETIVKLAARGVHAVDVSGRGGTNFALIENARRAAADRGLFADWGQSAPACLLDAATLTPRPPVELLASGGVRGPLDVVRALALRASAVGVSGRFLAILQESGVGGLIATIESWLAQIRDLMTVLGATTVSDLAATDVLVGGELREFCLARGIDPLPYAARHRVPSAQ